MQLTFELQHACIGLPLVAGAELTCVEGEVWVTLEARGSAFSSRDIILNAGQRHHVAGAATYFLTSIFDRRAVCKVDLGDASRGSLAGPLKRIQAALRGAQPSALLKISWFGR